MNAIFNREGLKRHRSNYIFVICLMFFTGFVGLVSLGRGFDFDAFYTMSGDGFYALQYIKSIQEHGLLGMWFNYRTGAPNVSTLIDFPAAGIADSVIYWILSWFTSSTPRIAYLFLILSFVLDGLSMYFLLDKLKIDQVINFVISSLFAFAPYHFYRYLGHNTLIVYISIPLAIYLGCYILGFVEKEKNWKIVLITIIIGIGYGYYYAFGLIIIFFAYIIKFIRLDNKKDILKELWIGILLVCVIFIGLLPKLIYGWVNGPNIEVGQRVFFEQEIYGLKIIQMLLPVSYSRIGFLNKLTNTYSNSGAPLINENATASLGIVASIGFIILCVAFVISYTKKTKSKEWALIDFIAVLTITFLLMGSVGGFGEIFNWVVTAQIRCYNRSSIVISCLAMIIIALLINKLKFSKMIYVPLCLVVLCVGMYDQVSVCSDNWQAGSKETQKMYEVYFDKVEDALDENAMVYQLPYMEFPEAGMVNNIGDYELFAGFLFTDNLRWSYGSVRGRDEETEALYIDNGMSFRFLHAIKQAGFSAVYIDLDGYADGGTEVLAFYNSLGIEPIVSDDGCLYLYDISDLQIPDFVCEIGYEFISNWSNEFSMNLTNEECADLAKSVGNLDDAAIKELYDSVRNTEIVISYTDKQYVDFLYARILGREESEDEQISWVNQLQNGISREEVFLMFLRSEEFRVSQGYGESEP